MPFKLFLLTKLSFNIAVIVGSVRRDRNGIKVGRWLENKISQRGHKVFFVDPMELDLPILDRMYKEMENPDEKFQTLRKMINNADGYLPVTPEYNHSTSAAMKNTLDYCLEEYFFKPSAIVSYSVGNFGGINAAQHLRQIFAELGSPSIPSSLQVSRVHEVFDGEGNLKNQDYERRLKKFLDEFEWYLAAFKKQRQQGTPY